MKITRLAGRRPGRFRAISICRANRASLFSPATAFLPIFPSRLKRHSRRPSWPGRCLLLILIPEQAGRRGCKLTSRPQASPKWRLQLNQLLPNNSPFNSLLPNSLLPGNLLLASRPLPGSRGSILTKKLPNSSGQSAASPAS